MSTQEDLKQGGYQYQGNGDRHNTISHDNNPNMTQFSSGFPKNPLSRRSTNQGGFLNQTADHAARIMGSSQYTNKDIQEARDGLKLLKSRMGATNSRRSINNNTSHSANRHPEFNNMNHSYTNSEKGPGNRKQYSRPPMIPASTTNLNSNHGIAGGEMGGGQGAHSSSNFRNKQF